MLVDVFAANVTKDWIQTLGENQLLSEGVGIWAYIQMAIDLTIQVAPVGTKRPFPRCRYIHRTHLLSSSCP